MSFTIIWEESAVAGFWRLHAQDRQGAIALGEAVAALAEEPHPSTSRPLGGTEFRRMRIGTYRVVYEIDEVLSTIIVHSVGRVPAGS